MVALMGWRKWLGLGPSTKDRLLDLLDLQSRQAMEDRRQVRVLLGDLNASHEKAMDATAGLVRELGKGIEAQTDTFKSYLALLTQPTPEGRQVRTMTDYDETLLERQVMKDRTNLDNQFSDPMIDQVALQDTMARDLETFLKELSSPAELLS